MKGHIKEIGIGVIGALSLVYTPYQKENTFTTSSKTSQILIYSLINWKSYENFTYDTPFFKDFLFDLHYRNCSLKLGDGIYQLKNSSCDNKYFNLRKVDSYISTVFLEHNN